MSSFYKKYDSIWIGWPGIATEEIELEKEEIKAKLISEYNCYPIFLSHKELELYLDNFSNKTIWPLYHYFPQYTSYNPVSWEGYQHVNELFCESMIQILGQNELIWIHDYHLMLLPQLLRSKLKDPTIGFFLHIPFPSFELYRLLPWRKEILEGLMGADVIGFHTYEYARHFLMSVHQLLGLETKLGQIRVKNRMIKVDSFPIGINYDLFSKISKQPEVQKEISEIRRQIGDCKLIFSIDRLDYTKGIPQRLEAFNLFLERYPEFKEKVKFVCVAVPSRINVDNYMHLKKEVDELVGRINGQYGTIGWTPIWYLYQFLPFEKLAALYSVADVALVTPLRDGMNLIAKEYIAAKLKGRGVLILSETAGAAKELGEALQINVNNINEIVEALKIALTMPKKEQIKRNRMMQTRLRRYNIQRWAEDFINVLISTKDFQKEIFVKFLSFEKRKEMIEKFLSSDNKLIFLSYEGTLFPSLNTLNNTKPPKNIIKLLKEFISTFDATVVLLSEMDKDILDKWFGGLKIALIAEHGVWIKRHDSSWEMIEPLTNEWKKEIRPIFELYTDRTPGSFIEEKEFSLLWNYRKTDSELGLIRARELANLLMNFTANFNLQVLDINQVIEIRNAHISKGRAATYWLSQKEWDFILAIGSDWSDELLFAALPESAYTIRVGLETSQAQFNVPLPSDVQLLLNEMIKQMPYKYQIKQIETQIQDLSAKINHLDFILRFQLDFYSKSYWQHIKSNLTAKKETLEKELKKIFEKLKTKGIN